MIHEGVIDLTPPYQRDVVWPENKQIGLIDSIFRNFFIPPVIFAVHIENGEETRVCVDGKQRLTSIQKFFDGVVSYRNTRTKKSYWYTMSDTHRGTKIELPESFKEEFREKTITVVEYRGLPPGSEREIFQRVQLGMSLTAAEKLQAISSPWGEWIGELESKHVNIEEGLGAKLSWDVSRGRDFQNIAHMIYCCDGYPNEQLLPTAQKIEKWISRADKPTVQFKEDIENVLRGLWVIATTEELKSGFVDIPQRVAPVEFIFIGVLLYVLRHESRENQASAIFILRTTVRQEFADIRNNTNVGRALWSYIQSLRKHPTRMPRTGIEIAPKGRRKRNAGVRDDDDEFRPQPVRAIGRPAKTRAKKTKTD
ncbi:hypothetical protein HYPSUDRAFT_126524 [Hypholoma sublateritium FD-334 SS-4]|uniref:GmrSD restriction endonucleases N-terminal domain-containing protein n=1 Tax=Hypholoma sublateritium (strain FD-334 SS-4) TaxID=945553 RepID=A0A0D2QF95_HYPSF|nr:hypothetical protein HYPSUDRAFT_126524 [Hypholoma sublateritium FD-334 SS-4]